MTPTNRAAPDNKLHTFSTTQKDKTALLGVGEHARSREEPAYFSSLLPAARTLATFT